jgi:hypothetical protein
MLQNNEEKEFDINFCNKTMPKIMLKPEALLHQQLGAEIFKAN